MTTTVYPLPFEKGWVVRPCLNRAGHIASLDIGPPTEPGARGGSVIASVYSGHAVADLLSAAPELYDALYELMYGPGETLAATHAKARAALAKARGEQVSA